MNTVILKNINKITDSDNMVNISLDATQHAIKTYSVNDAPRSVIENFIDRSDLFYTLYHGDEVSMCD